MPSLETSRVPDLFIIGAPKCGTTSIYEYLTGHPDVFMSAVKEPNYFARDLAVDRSPRSLIYDRDRGRYGALFAASGAPSVLEKARRATCTPAMRRC